MNEGIFDRDVFGRKQEEYENVETETASAEARDNYVPTKKEAGAASDVVAAIRACHAETMEALLRASGHHKQPVAQHVAPVAHDFRTGSAMPMVLYTQDAVESDVAERFRQLEDRLQDIITVAVEEAVHNAIVARGGIDSLFGREADDSEPGDERSREPHPAAVAHDLEDVVAGPADGRTPVVLSPDEEQRALELLGRRPTAEELAEAERLIAAAESSLHDDAG